MHGIFWGKMGIKAVVFSLIMYAANTVSATPDESKGLLPPVKPSKTYLNLSKVLLLEKSDVTIKDKENKVKAVFTITNDSKENVTDVEIVCIFVDQAQKEQERETWIVHDTVKAQTTGISTMTKNKAISKNAIGTQCQIVDVKIVKTPPIAAPQGEEKESKGDASKAATKGNP
jgi:hypothetical protein